MGSAIDRIVSLHRIDRAGFGDDHRHVFQLFEGICLVGRPFSALPATEAAIDEQIDTGAIG